MYNKKNKDPSFLSKWRKFSKYGKRMKSIPVMCLKTPLKSAYNCHLNKKQRFSVQDFVTENAKNSINIGAIIDLTNTTKYYSPEEVTQLGLKYYKLAIPGQGVPREENVNEFVDLLGEALLEQEEDEIVGVHCTHGVNRTGYLIVKYLRERMGVSIEEAMKEFEEARGHNIGREYLREDLGGAEWEVKCAVQAGIQEEEKDKEVMDWTPKGRELEVELPANGLGSGKEMTELELP